SARRECNIAYWRRASRSARCAHRRAIAEARARLKTFRSRSVRTHAANGAVDIEGQQRPISDRALLLPKAARVEQKMPQALRPPLDGTTRSSEKRSLFFGRAVRVQGLLATGQSLSGCQPIERR